MNCSVFIREYSLAVCVTYIGCCHINKVILGFCPIFGALAATEPKPDITSESFQPTKCKIGNVRLEEFNCLALVHII